eukprot:CAMPEP_0185617438 /NCGR_PEP_ID=MMETSP0436-20130131/43514_1 /TAXON_ID=626734 ORGANISM="Favella taraikaensis, Strain Fe Narragansett Bay" /NCGR_SAMPLE_ID=MMETSP0436 /ASSEMBLY_ACC=CAM_ASM_000390 /LENGTH=50 /DNA_ID=CAMNT_0028255113 /DNA_START=51 /DNA_END=199 /DNA_ORIENTATION=+
MPTCSRSYFELHNGMSLNGTNRRSLGPGMVSKMVYLAEALSMKKDGTVLS